MTTRRLRVFCTALAPWVATASLLAAPIGQPTPCPCTADGACIPHRQTWGYTKTQWRLWPGTTLDDRGPTEAPPAGQDAIGPTLPPDPRMEDQLAPPKVEALDAEAAEEPAAPATEFELPEMEAPTDEQDRTPEPDPLAIPRPGFMDRLPGEEPADAPNGENGRPDAMPTLPFGQPPAVPLETPQPPDDLFPSNTHGRPAAPVAADDAPPALPFGFERGAMPAALRAAPSAGFVVQASAHSEGGLRQAAASPIPVEASPRGVVRAAAVSRAGDAPPQLPRGLFGSR